MKDSRYSARTIDELASQLTSEERERFSNLIEECKDREPENKINEINIKLQLAKKEIADKNYADSISDYFAGIEKCKDEYNIIKAIQEKPFKTSH